MADQRVLERRQEEPILGNLAVPCHLEESASHHLGHPSRERGGMRSTVLQVRHVTDVGKILIKCVTGTPTGVTPSRQFGCRVSPGGECFAPLGALPLREGGCAKHSPPGDANEKSGEIIKKS